MIIRLLPSLMGNPANTFNYYNPFGTDFSVYERSISFFSKETTGSTFSI